MLLIPSVTASYMLQSGDTLATAKQRSHHRRDSVNSDGNSGLPLLRDNHASAETSVAQLRATILLKNDIISSLRSECTELGRTIAALEVRCFVKRLPENH